MAGYSGTPLIKKLGIRENSALLLVDPPEHYRELLGPLPQGTELCSELDGERKFAFIHAFIHGPEAIRETVATLGRRIDPDGMLWISWTKKSSKNFSGITEDMIRGAALASGLVDVKICAVDEDWSGLKLVYRVRDRK